MLQSGVRSRYTGKERDSESGLDNFGARYMSSRMGRFMSPDPLGNFVADLSNPQSLNQYSYVLNNPLRYTDPTGLDYCDIDDGGYYEKGSCPTGYWVTSQPGTISTTAWGSANGSSSIDGWMSTWGLGTLMPFESNQSQQPANNTAQRLKCAAQFGTNHSIAAAFGAQNNFLANLLGGNSVSGLVNLGLFISGDATPTAAQLASIPLKGAAQGIPVPPGNPGLSGAVGQLRGMAVQGAVAGTYNAIAGVGQETIELGITASGTVATPVAQLGAETLSNVAFGAGVAKFAWDLGTVGYGYFFACK